MSLDPITVEVIGAALSSIVEETGEALIRASYSTNIKERRDCSTALFDAAGELVMQAEHIPVHLGSMPDAVAAILDDAAAAEPRSEWILNDPFRGGTHLPDITLISALHDGDERLLGFAASRAHHADVGGPTPGSMPFDSRTLDQEGVVIEPVRVEAGTLEALAARMRNPAQRLADLRAQRAANRIGAERVAELADREGEQRLRSAMSEVLDYGERRTRARLAELPDGRWEAGDVLEGGPDGRQDLELRVEARVDGERLELDFSGSADQVDGNLNCPLAVTRSAALFAVRVLLDPDAPPSAGAHRPIVVTAPEGSILNARAPAAVAAGNVETSSRVADLVMAALAEPLGAPAQGQGTMNNLTLSDPSGAGFTYYETLGGGQGACADAAGPDAIHVAMSNTLNTPVEVIEAELPVRIRELGLRRGSGGAGQQRGGDGLVREIEALEPLAYSLITERRRHPPRGRAGGSDGAAGRNLLDGEELAGKAGGTLEPGQALRIETPGGGGYGAG